MTIREIFEMPEPVLEQVSSLYGPTDEFGLPIPLLPKVAPTYYYCPFINTKDCSGTCSGINPDGSKIRCPHNIEAELNRVRYYKGLPMFAEEKTMIAKKK